jgi:hypothetical protein
LRYLGAYGANYTGAMIGGFAVSDTHCISVGSSRGHKEVTSNDGYHLGYDAYITATNKKTIFSENTRVAQEDVSYEGDTKIIWLTDFALDGNAMIQPVAIWGKIRLFGKVYVRFGEPFSVQDKLGEECLNDRAAVQQLAAETLENIYNMMEVPGEISQG